VRVIAGTLRSRRLAAVPGGVRPTPDRVREALFAQLGDAEGMHVLDLYAGTGALGLAALSRGAESVVFVERSPRFVTIEQAERVITALPPFVEPVGLFVDANVDQVWSVCEALGLRTVQLHGGETPTYISQLIDLRVLKSVSFDPRSFDDAAALWRGAPRHVTGLLWDTPPADGDALPGGSGRRFDWHAMAELRRAARFDDLPPLILAGGLTADNVADAVTAVRPYAVDVSSGVERTRGEKCPALIAAFCQAVREADAGVEV